MRTSVAIIVPLLALAGTATAQDKPAGPPPVFKFVDSVDKDKSQITFTYDLIRFVPVVKEVTVNVNGMQVKQLIMETIPVTETRTTVIDLAKSKIVTPDGKDFPLGDAWKRLKKGAVVLVSETGNTPAQAYLKALSAETLVVIPPATMINPPAAIPVPPPVKVLPQPAPKKT